MGIKQRLRPYQLEAAHAILKSVLQNRGLTFTVEVARQGGKNELSAQLELLLLTLNRSAGGNLIKAAPTYMPQLLNSIFRLKDRLNDAGYKGLWAAEGRNSFRVGRARQVFLSAEPSSRVVGATAHVLLEMDEAQEIDKTKYYKEFRPMGASTNVTTVLYGTPWDGDSLLEEQKQLNLELERHDGSAVTSATTGRTWRGTTRSTGNTWRANGSGWEKTTPCSAASTCFCRCLARGACSAHRSRPSFRAATRAAAGRSRARPTWRLWTWRAESREAIPLAPGRLTRPRQWETPAQLHRAHHC